MGNANCQCLGQKESIIDLEPHTNGGTGGDVRAPACCCCSDPDSAQAVVPVYEKPYVPDYVVQHSARGTNDAECDGPSVANPYTADTMGSVPNVPPLDFQEVAHEEAYEEGGHEEAYDSAGGANEEGGDGYSAEEWAQNQDQFAHLPPLPEGWIRVMSRSTGQIYFCFVETGETTFDEPTGPPGAKDKEQAAKTTSQEKAPAPAPAASAASGKTLPPGWTEVVSRSSGQTYYWNATLQKSQFDFPTESTPPVQDKAGDDNNLPPGWVAMVSRSTGKTYYFHNESQKSQFDFPTGPP